MGKKDAYELEFLKYEALKKYCLRYWKNKLEIEAVLKSGGTGFVSGSKIEGMYSNPTENKAIKITDLKTDCEIIEKIVKKVCADYDVLAGAKRTLNVSDFILLNVTTVNRRNSYRGLKKRGYNIPVGRDIFYLLRHKFFYELSEYFKD